MVSFMVWNKLDGRRGSTMMTLGRDGSSVLKQGLKPAVVDCIGFWLRQLDPFRWLGVTIGM